MKLSKKTLEGLIRSSNAFITKQSWPKDEYTKQFEQDIKKSPLLGTAMSNKTSLTIGQVNYRPSGEQNAKG